MEYVFKTIRFYLKMALRPTSYNIDADLDGMFESAKEYQQKLEDRVAALESRIADLESAKEQQETIDLWAPRERSDSER